MEANTEPNTANTPRAEAPRDQLRLVLAFSVPGRPEQRGSKVPIVLYNRDGSPRLGANGRPILFAKDDNPRSGPYMAAVKKAATIAMAGRPLIDAPIMLGADFYFARPKNHYYQTKARHGELRDDAPTYHAKSPDLAKLMRCVEDGMTKAVWIDDALVYGYEAATRHWGEPRADVRVYLNPADAEAWREAGAF